MAKADQIEIPLRIVIQQPVIGVFHSLQSKDDTPLDAKCSQAGAPLAFDFTVRVGPGPKFFGDQVRREGPERRFVYVRVGQSAGDPASPWNGRMKIDIHDLDRDLLDRAMAGDGVIEIIVSGAGRNGGPAYATAKPLARRLVALA